MGSVVWFKRDFRVQDHTPLATACANGAIIPLYIIEPEYWQLPDTSARQWQFIRGCLQELEGKLKTLGSQLIVRVGSATDVLAQLHEETNFTKLYSHEETGNLWTYERDKTVKHWCQKMDIPWQEFRQFGVVRGTFDRDTGGKDAWATQWNKLMAAPLAPTPKEITTPKIPTEILPTAEKLGMKNDGLINLQPSGRSTGVQELTTFLTTRGAAYQTDMSSPILGEQGCSRLSPHITYGTLSIREIYQAARRKRTEILSWPQTEQKKWPNTLRAFIGRLHWHCHFIQKLESEPELEVNNPNPAFDMLDRTADEAHIQAWITGYTGYPYIDACMRMLIATGWLNFRARAMLMSFASYHLWLDWRHTAPKLARLFTDYEPGIHYSQTHMQSGVTGINQIRIYNPIKQGQEYDPNGEFIAKWMPELATLPAVFRHEPWKLPPGEALMYGFELGKTYPNPLVDHATASKMAKEKTYAIFKSPQARVYAKDVFEKHGSRKKQARKAKRGT